MRELEGPPLVLALCPPMPSITPGVTVQSGNLPLRPLLSMCEMGLKGKLRVTVTTQIQIRNWIAADLPIDSQCPTA